jgi:hypothetical protein
MERTPMERRRLACSEREARIVLRAFSRLRRSLQAARLRSSVDFCDHFCAGV